MRESNPAIWARGICKTYGGKNGKPVLDGLDITVEKGTIYALLGASGCGKTTILSCIVGSKIVDSGEIRILGKKPGGQVVKKIGYMPQETALTFEFSVKGAIQHYGWLFGLTNQEIDQRFEFLNNLLDLPPKDRLIKQLSGGQKRRVSLAVALVHNPEVLILDEPTVGLESVLRQKIWDYLIHLADNEGKTIVMTTHYIEEAKQAHAIGLMRNGKLLAEGAPEALMTKYNCTNVEEIFLLLSRKQLEGNIVAGEIDVHDLELEDIISGTREPEPEFEDEGKSWCQVLLSYILFTNKSHAKALLLKNAYTYLRNKESGAYYLLFPLIQITLFLITVGGDPRTLKLGIVNYELDDFLTCNDLANNMTLGGFRLPDDEHCTYTGLSCKFLIGLPEKLSRHVYYQSFNDAYKAARDGKINAVIVFHSHFTEKTALLREDQKLTGEDLDDVQIEIFMDKSNYPISLFLERNLLERYTKYSEEIEKECGFNPRASRIPIKKLPAVYSSYDANYREFMIPGCLLSTTLFFGISVACLSVVTERTEGSWDRTLVAGVSKTEVMVFHFLLMFGVNVIQIIIIFSVTFGVFQAECRGSFIDCLVVMLCEGLVGITMGLFLSVISKNVTDCIQISLGVCYPFLALSGIIWPLEGINPALRAFSKIFIPSTLPVECLGNIINRGWSIMNFQVAKGFYVIGGYVIVLNALNIIILTFEKR